MANPSHRSSPRLENVQHLLSVSFPMPSPRFLPPFPHPLLSSFPSFLSSYLPSPLPSYLLPCQTISFFTVIASGKARLEQTKRGLSELPPAIRRRVWDSRWGGRQAAFRMVDWGISASGTLAEQGVGRAGSHCVLLGKSEQYAQCLHPWKGTNYPDFLHVMPENHQNQWTKCFVLFEKEHTTQKLCFITKLTSIRWQVFGLKSGNVSTGKPLALTLKLPTPFFTKAEIEAQKFRFKWLWLDCHLAFSHSLSFLRGDNPISKNHQEPEFV